MTLIADHLIDIHSGLPYSDLTAEEHVGFELGWDHAHYRVDLPAPYLSESSSLGNGFLAGQAAFGTRTLSATRHVRKWLQLRLHAWLRGRSVELVQVTPNYLQQIEVAHCPIARTPLSSSALASSDASVDRVRNDAGYAAGNLAMMSLKANHAKAAWGMDDARRFAQQIEAEQLPGMGGLNAAQWWRVHVLGSFVQPLSHAEACEIPLLVLPPNRLRMFNPVQALQAFVSQQLLRPGWSQRVSRFEDLLPDASLRRDFKSFFMTLLPRVIEGGLEHDRRAGAPAAPASDFATRCAIEDAWRATLVQQRWARFATRLSSAQCESLLARAVARRLTSRTVWQTSDATATDGWNLATRGYAGYAGNAFGRAAEGDSGEPQMQLAW